MDNFTLYTDAECTLIAASGFIGEYRRIYGVVPSISTAALNRTYPDGTAVRQYQIANYNRSTVYADEPTQIPLTITPTDTTQYLYFTPTARIAFHCYGSIGNCTVGHFTFEYDFGDGFTWVAPAESSNLDGIYKPKYIVLRAGTAAQYDNYGTLITIDKNAWLGIDFVYDDSQGRETTERCVVAISDYELYLDKTTDTKPYKPKTGNTTKRAGTGTGYYPNSRVPALPTNAINAAFASVLGVGNGLTYYKLTGDCLSAITEFLYDTTLTLKFRNSEYRDAIASMVFIPYNVQADRINTKRTIYLANRGIYPNDSCDFITTPLREIDFGEINLTAETVGYKTFADYTLTTATLYLPCYGAVNLDMHSIANGILHLRAVIDVRNGNILYRLETQSGVDDLPVLYGQYSGNCGIPVPVGGSNAGATLLGAVTSIGAVATGIATANPVTAVAGMAGAISELVPFQAAPSIDKSGALQPAAAAYGTPVPVLQIMKKIMLAPPEWGTVNGFLSGGKDGETEYTLSDFTGYFRAAACDVSGIDGATEQEKQQIKNLLETGVYL